MSVRCFGRTDSRQMHYAAFRRLRSLCVRSLNAALTLTARCRQSTGEGNDDDDYRNKLSSQGRRDDMPPTADGSSTRGGSTSVCGRVRSPHICGDRPAAGSQRAYSLDWDRQTDGSRYQLMPHAIRLVAWHSGRTSVSAGELSLSCARPAADG